MTTIAVTGATGHFGRIALAQLRLLAPDATLIALAHRPERAAGLAELGAEVRFADYVDEQSVHSALRGVDRLLLVSGSDIRNRVFQHGNVITAARATGVSRIVYTSIAHANTSMLPMAHDHVMTERLLAQSGLPHVVARNNWYSDNYLPLLDSARTTGEIVAATGGGRVASASRADYAEAAARLLISDSVPTSILELSGESSWDYLDLADAIAGTLHRDVSLREVTAEEQRAELREQGLPEAAIDQIVAIDVAIAAGALDHPSAVLEDILGRPATTLRSTLAGIAD